MSLAAAARSLRQLAPHHTRARAHAHHIRALKGAWRTLGHVSPVAFVLNKTPSFPAGNTVVKTPTGEACAPRENRLSPTCRNCELGVKAGPVPARAAAMHGHHTAVANGLSKAFVAPCQARPAGGAVHARALDFAAHFLDLLRSRERSSRGQRR